ncbi:DUF6702 family protein [Porphyrobacter sp. AAP60]|uniref:DUF6702 family protein n=1 Tax=Porphyrobacter sp. AAP60 TaxID=1523423 RepID=UPI0012E0EA6F|nr:DUF6702 family protein [Porphyrobacter sp. AAP60]
MIRRLLVVVAMLLAAPLMAHQQKIAISTVSLNPRTDRIEITHQVPVHDAEHALRMQGARVPDIVGSAKSREEFAAYVTRRFLLTVNGETVTPGYVGSEISGGSLMVYQETPAPAGEARLTVNSQILTDVWARQENRVNIGAGTQVETFIFGAGDTPRDAMLGG